MQCRLSPFQRAPGCIAAGFYTSVTLPTVCLAWTHMGSKHQQRTLFPNMSTPEWPMMTLIGEGPRACHVRVHGHIATKESVKKLRVWRTATGPPSSGWEHCTRCQVLSRNIKHKPRGSETTFSSLRQLCRMKHVESKVHYGKHRHYPPICWYASVNRSAQRICT